MIKLTKKRKPRKGIIHGANNQLTETIPFNENGSIDSIKISLDIEHPSMGDIIAKIINPEGIEVYLHNRVDIETNTLTTVFDSSVLTPFIGKKVEGDWTLIIEDQIAKNEGILYSWSIGIEYLQDEVEEIVADFVVTAEAEEIVAAEAEVVVAEAEVAAAEAEVVVAEAKVAVAEAEVAAAETEVEVAAAEAEVAAAEAEVAAAEAEVVVAEAEVAIAEAEVAIAEVLEAEAVEIEAEVAPAEAEATDEGSILDQIKEEAASENSAIVPMNNEALMSMLGGSKVNLGKISTSVDKDGNLFLELIKPG